MDLKWFLLIHFSIRIQNAQLVQDGYHIEIEDVVNFLMIFRAQTNVLFIIKVKNLVIFIWSYMFPMIMLNVEYIMAIMF